MNLDNPNTQRIEAMPVTAFDSELPARYEDAFTPLNGKPLTYKQAMRRIDELNAQHDGWYYVARHTTDADGKAGYNIFRQNVYTGKWS